MEKKTNIYTFFLFEKSYKYKKGLGFKVCLPVAPSMNQDGNFETIHNDTYDHTDLPHKCPTSQLIRGIHMGNVSKLAYVQIALFPVPTVTFSSTS
jgi:hypothetical protein